MRRATLAMACALSALLTQSLPARAQVSGKTMNGIGLIDFSRTPDLKPGQWVRYHVTASSATGSEDDYVMTVGIPGMERFWGDDCFWVETVTESKNGPMQSVATLMSYSIFDDPDPQRNLQMFQRKLVMGLDVNGAPEVTVTRRPPESLRLRSKHAATVHLYFDTLGTDTVRVPFGLFDARKIRIRQGAGNTSDRGDSTQYEEMYETRVDFLTPKVPVTGLAREDIDYLYQAKTWLIGRSNSGELMTKEHSIGKAELIGTGMGFKSTLLPATWQADRRPADGEKYAAPRKPVVVAAKKPATSATKSATSGAKPATSGTKSATSGTKPATSTTTKK
jgi:hypothetical protein